MFDFHHLKISIRRLLKNRVFTLVNIGGLAFGFACCIMIALFVLDELSYDQYHHNKDRIHRLSTHAQMGDNSWNSVVVSPALGPAMTEDIPDVEMAVRLSQFDQVTVSNRERAFIENDVLAADEDFFDLFSFKMLEGDPKTALSEPRTIVLTRQHAIKYFNTDQGVLGQTLELNNVPYEITGIIAEIPRNSHFLFDLVYSYSSLSRAENPQWQNSNSPTYVLLKEDAEVDAVQDQIMALMERRSGHYNQILESGFSWEIGTNPLTKIHLHSHLEDELAANGDLRSVQFMILIAAFILLIAVINFINMSTARSADRAKEIGVRKTMGVTRKQLIHQFLTESSMIALVAGLLGLAMAFVLKYPFEVIVGKNIITPILANPLLVASCLVIALIVGIAAGVYPAFYITRFKPVDVFSGTLSSSKSPGYLRNGLVIFQFVIATALIACTIVVSDQLKFIRTKDVGFNREHVITIKNADKLNDNFDAFQNGILSNPGVVSIGYSDFGPLDDKQGSTFIAEGRSENEARLMAYTLIDPGYIPTMDIQMLAGRNFREKLASDNSAIILNEAASKSLSFEDPIGKKVLWGSALQVIGVVRDFHFMSMEEEIKPMVFMLAKSGEVFEVRLKPENITQTLSQVEQLWDTHTRGTSPFLYTFVDEDFQRQYEKYERLNRVFGSFSFLAIFISCLGLFALSAFMTEQRTKEIGIRKVLGATVENITLLLSKEFTQLVIVALIIAIPVSYFIMNQWLENFIYRITLGIKPFLITAIVVLLIAWVTVSFHSIHAALTNPVKALKDE